MRHKLLITLAFTISAMIAWGKAADGDAVPQTKGAHCTFTDGMRYSELVINSRLNDFKANTTPAGFGVFDATGHLSSDPTGTKNNLDYVPGLVAKAVMEAVDYYRDADIMDVRPWFYAIQHYGNRLDISSNNVVDLKPLMGISTLYFLNAANNAHGGSTSMPSSSGTIFGVSGSDARISATFAARADTSASSSAWV